MKARTWVAVFAISLAAVAAWWWAAEPDLTPEVAGTVADSGQVAFTPAPPAVTSAPVANPPPRAPAPPPAPARVVRPSLYGDLVKARSYRELYNRLQGTAEGQTSEGQLVLYEILRQCATITDGRRWNNARQALPKRDDFVVALATADPTRDKRIAAYDEFAIDRCAGFDGIALTQADLNKLLQDAASAGDPRAKALTIEQEMWRARRQSGDSGATLSDAQIDNLKSAVASRDPEAMRVAGRVLATTWSDYALRVGPDQMPVEPRPFMNAWLVLACEYGAPCGSDTPRMLQACALQGHCDATNYPDYLYQYGSTPHESNLVSHYRGLLRQAIESGDWSQINVVRGLPSPSNRAWFVPGPR